MEVVFVGRGDGSGLCWGEWKWSVGGNGSGLLGECKWSLEGGWKWSLLAGEMEVVFDGREMKVVFVGRGNGSGLCWEGKWK